MIVATVPHSPLGKVVKVKVSNTVVETIQDTLPAVNPPRVPVLLHQLCRAASSGLSPRGRAAQGGVTAVAAKRVLAADRVQPKRVALLGLLLRRADGHGQLRLILLLVRQEVVLALAWRAIVHLVRERVVRVTRDRAPMMVKGLAVVLLVRVVHKGAAFRLLLHVVGVVRRGEGVLAQRRVAVVRVDPRLGVVPHGRRVLLPIRVALAPASDAPEKAPHGVRRPLASTKPAEKKSRRSRKETARARAFSFARTRGRFFLSRLRFCPAGTRREVRWRACTSSLCIGAGRSERPPAFNALSPSLPS
mmetsp:Transcript_39087/g.83726  ORF Transcript_39087/g.83726 Transcript_39087/m.83726 type:complete len:304 (-) Transcript_39087:206-1117(-)